MSPATIYIHILGGVSHRPQPLDPRQLVKIFTALYIYTLHSYQLGRIRDGLSATGYFNWQLMNFGRELKLCCFTIITMIQYISRLHTTTTTTCNSFTFTSGQQSILSANKRTQHPHLSKLYIHTAALAQFCKQFPQLRSIINRYRETRFQDTTVAPRCRAKFVWNLR